MLEFLLGVLLTILIFTPTCLFTAKIFRLSQQGQDSFQDFAAEIKDLETVKAGKEAIRISVLTLDEQTAWVYFQPDYKETLLKISPATDYKKQAEVYFERPSACPEGSNCLCLFQKYEINGAAGAPTPFAHVIAESPSCSVLSLRLYLSVTDGVEHSCSLGTPGLYRPTYSCPQGFVIERGLVQKVVREVQLDGEYGYLNNDRRVTINLLKSPSDSSVLLTPEIPVPPTSKK